MISWKSVTSVVLIIGLLVYGIVKGFVPANIGVLHTSNGEDGPLYAPTSIQTQKAASQSEFEVHIADFNNISDATTDSSDNIDSLVEPKTLTSDVESKLRQDAESRLDKQRLAKFEFILAKYGLPKLPTSSDGRIMTLSGEFKRAWYLDHLRNTVDDNVLLNLAEDIDVNERFIGTHFRLVRTQTEYVEQRQKALREKEFKAQRHIASRQSNQDPQPSISTTENPQLAGQLQASRSVLSRVVAEQLAKNL